MLTDLGCIPNVIDEYNKLLASPEGQLTNSEWSVGESSSSTAKTTTTTAATVTTSTALATISGVEMSNLKEVNSLDDLVSGRGKKKRKGLGKKKNRKNKKSKIVRKKLSQGEEQGTSDAVTGDAVSRRSHELTDGLEQIPPQAKQDGLNYLPTGHQSEQINSVSPDMRKREERKRSYFFSRQNE